MIPVAARGAVALMNCTEIGIDFLFQAIIASQIFSALGAMVAIGWFLTSSGYSLGTRGLTVAAALVFVGGFATAVRKVEFDGQMTPTLRFRWEPSDDRRLQDHRASVPPAATPADLTIGPADSPRFRGILGDGVTLHAAAFSDITEAALAIRWRQPVGGGHAGIAVAGNSVVTLEQRGPNEAIVCYDRNTGRERWVHSYPARFNHSEPMGGDGPRATPTVDGGDVFSLGGAGDLFRLDGATGRPKWHVNILTDNSATSPEWGVAGSPLVLENRVIVNPGINPAANAGRAVAAYDREAGRRVWANGSHPAAYASPLHAELDGVPQVLIFDADGLGGYDPNDGNELWRYPWKTDMGMNSAQPLVLGPQTVFVSSERSNGGAALEVSRTGNGWNVRTVWRTRTLSARFASPVFHNGYIYGLSEGRLVCVNALTGSRIWAEGYFGNGQVLRAWELLIVTSETGSAHLIAADPEEYRQLGSVEVFGHRTWNMPTLAGNQLFIRSHREMACVELPALK